VLVLLGGTTWASGGFWAPDGIYSRFIAPIIGLVWVIVAKPGSVDPQSRHPRRMVMPALAILVPPRAHLELVRIQSTIDN